MRDNRRKQSYERSKVMFDTLVLLGLAGAAYGVYRYRRSLAAGGDRAAETPEERAGGDPMSPGYGLEDKTYGDARFADFALPQDAPLMHELLQEGDGIFLGWALGEFDQNWETHGERVMRYSGRRHLLTVAPTSSGKGTCAIIANLLCSPRSIICIDPKGQNAAVTARFRSAVSETFVLNPFNEHGLGTSRFNPLAHLRIDDPNVFADVASLAEALILTEGKDPHWPDSARNLIAVIILHLLATKGGKATLPEIRSVLGLSDEKLVEKIGEMQKSRIAFISELAGQFLGNTSEIKNIVSTARTQTKFLSDPLIADPRKGVLTGDDFRLGDFKQRPSTLFVILPSRHMAAYARFLRLLVVSAIDQLTSTTGGLKTLLMLDEFKMLGHLSAVETAFSLAAGYNLQIWPFVQNLNQLRDVYGETGWLDFISGCGVIQWFAPNDDFTAEYISKRVGDYTQSVMNRSVNDSENTSNNRGFSHGAGGKGKNLSFGEGTSSSRSSNYSWSKVGRRLIPPHNVMALPEDKQYLMLNGLKYPVLGIRRPYYHIKGIAALADRDPFHRAAPNAKARKKAPAA
jgi:type IV secretion system protein VirD4